MVGFVFLGGCIVFCVTASTIRYHDPKIVAESPPNPFVNGYKNHIIIMRSAYNLITVIIMEYYEVGLCVVAAFDHSDLLIRDA